jgi:hypothetical protein
VERVGAGATVVEVWGRDPFGVAVVVFPGGPALFGQWVVAAAAERQVVDVVLRHWAWGVQWWTSE